MASVKTKKIEELAEDMPNVETESVEKIDYENLYKDLLKKHQELKYKLELFEDERRLLKESINDKDNEIARCNEKYTIANDKLRNENEEGDNLLRKRTNELSEALTLLDVFLKDDTSKQYVRQKLFDNLYEKSTKEGA